MPLNICFIASRCIPRGRILAYYHGLHHSTWGTPDEPLYVNFAKNPLIVVPLFALNALPIFAVEYLLRAGLAPGMMVGFVAYFVAHEEIHWRIHFGGWLPPWLEPGRRHHLQHHAAEEERFNIFFPPFRLVVPAVPRQQTASLRLVSAAASVLVGTEAQLRRSFRRFSARPGLVSNNPLAIFVPGPTFPIRTHAPLAHQQA